MTGGFSFCGVDIESLGLVYAPGMADTYVWDEAPASLIEESFNSHKGGYFYGTAPQPKTFTLRCIFEDQHVNNGILTKITSFFRKGKTGRLAFKQREWVWYAATVIDCDISRITNYRNGMITISMKAYYPFGRFDELGIPDELELFILNRSIFDGDKLGGDPNTKHSAVELKNFMNNSGLIYKSLIPKTSFATYNKPLRGNQSFLLYNGGTEYADVAIEIAGNVGKGVTIRNKTTGDECRIVALTDAACQGGMFLSIDSMNGKTLLTNGSTMTKYGFLYHDGGFITLAPSGPIKRNVKIKDLNLAMSDTLIYSDDAENDDVGKYIRVGREWFKITDIRTFPDGIAYKVDHAITNTNDFNDSFTEIVTMNEMEIEFDAGSDINKAMLTKLDFKYKPTFM